MQEGMMASSTDESKPAAVTLRYSTMNVMQDSVGAPGSADVEKC